MLEEANSEYENMEAELNEMNNKIDKMLQDIEEKVFTFYISIYL